MAELLEQLLKHHGNQLRHRPGQKLTLRQKLGTVVRDGADMDSKPGSLIPVE